MARQNEPSQPNRRPVPMVPETPAAWTEFLQILQRDCFLIGPMTSRPELPEGFIIDRRIVLIDVGTDTYKVGFEQGDEQHALTKSGIEKLAIACGAAAKPTRVDDRSDRFYCEYEAVAGMRLLDGTDHYAMGSRSYDMNDDGAESEAAAEIAYAKKIKSFEYDARDGKPVPPNDQWDRIARDAGASAVRQLRGTFKTQCESKAKLRALRSLMGIRSKYAKSELLSKHFVVFVLKWTGHSNDPQLRRQFAMMTAQRFLGASSALYGTNLPGAAPAALPHIPHADEPKHALPHSGPPAEEPDPDEFVDPDTGEVTGDTQGTSTVAQGGGPPVAASTDGAGTSPAPKAEASSGTPVPAGPASPATSQPSPPGPIIPRGFEGQGTPLADAPIPVIEGAMGKAMTMLGSGKLDDAQKARADAFVKACAAELDKREAAGKQGEMAFGSGS